MSDAGTYYLKATNGQGTTNGPNATLTVLAAAPPAITLQPQSQTIYVNQQATFTVAASVPPISYQWWFNSNTIPSATNSAYTVFSADATKAGSYKATLVNAFGTSTSSVATLTVLAAPPGYPTTVLQLNPLVYYRFEDISNNLAIGNSNVFNFGSLGTTATGLLEGNATNGPGPQPPPWPNFGATNQALALDPSTNVDVRIPALNLDPSVQTNITLAAWINPSQPPIDYAGIVFYRGSGGASGLGLRYDGSLAYHWANQYYGFASGLHAPTNGQQWSFVALAVQPTQATLYLNDGTGFQSATNVAAHGAAPFAGPAYVGWDSESSGNRRFVGTIDEPMIFSRTLSPDEINALYHAGIGPVKVQISHSAGTFVLSWPVGVLQQSSQPGTGYSDTAFTSPYTNTPGPIPTFYRVRIP
jgi:hypothetical protein